MKRILYTRANDGGLDIVAPVLSLDDCEQALKLLPESLATAVIKSSITKDEHGENKFLIGKLCENLRSFEVVQDFILNRALNKIPSDAKDIHVVDEESVPRDRTFRDAWEVSDGKVVCNIEKAKKIHLERIKVSAKEYLMDADIDDLLSGSDKKTILKEHLSNVDVSKASRPEDLVKIWPELLPLPTIYTKEKHHEESSERSEESERSKREEGSEEGSILFS